MCESRFVTEFAGWAQIYIWMKKVFALGSAHKPESMPLDSTYESPKKTNEQKKEENKNRNKNKIPRE